MSAVDGASSTTTPTLDAATVYGIASLELRARVVAEGLLAGAHRSKRFGSSADFAEHKLYTPGDDLRHLDWKVLGKNDRSYVKRFMDETRLPLVLVVDASSSMAYAGGARGSYHHQKLDTARTLAAALAWLAVRRGDPTSLSVFAADESAYLPARAPQAHLSAVLAVLDAAQAGGTTDLAGTLAAVVARVKQRSLVVLVSDLIDVGVTALDALAVLRKRGCDVLVVQTLDRDELELPFDGVIRFEDLESERVVQVDAPLVKDAYQLELEIFLSDIRARCVSRDLRYTLAVTDESPVLVLERALQVGA